MGPNNGHPTVRFCLQHLLTLLPNLFIWGSISPLLYSRGQVEMTPFLAPGPPQLFPGRGGWFAMATESIKANTVV